ncbi:hypothetical protein K469DRAFT_693922 [Zopfia rhizophila CBS 207.26]|uniref:PKS/mFAS DH domain-containing protein n=1 Tax=Zopfia rhizophila CBS 207.26 TaxID=1314779 RepID=A0A6A6DMD9_9PEZI|nr:hypothetical protein K469DRAFT_693922 [Zopfia rhizophila CBS 207.26]
MPLAPVRRSATQIYELSFYASVWRICKSVNKAEFTQPLRTTVQIGLVNAVTRHGTSPSAVVGHSSGEIAAAFAPGALSMPEAIICAYYRGYVSTQQKLKVGMAVIGLGPEDVAPFLKPGVVVACENSTSSTTISGDADKLKEVVMTIMKRSLMFLRASSRVDMAYHSHHMQALVKTYIGFVKEELADKRLTRSNTRVPLFSSATNQVITHAAELRPEYWDANLTSPVQFAPAVSTLVQYQPNNLFLEIGPHSTLGGPLRQISRPFTTCLSTHGITPSSSGRRAASTGNGVCDHTATMPSWASAFRRAPTSTRNGASYMILKASYSVRHVVAHTALVLKESSSVEPVTSLNKHKLTDSYDSEAYEFNISSYSGSIRIKHAEGLVKLKEELTIPTEKIEELPRNMPAQKWYEIVERLCLVYDPEFQGISQLTASTTELKSEDVISNTKARQDAPFLFHLAGIDSCLQLMLAAVTQAAGRNFTQLAAPTLIEELDISRSAMSMNVRAWSSSDGKDVGLDCIADGHVAMRLRGARLTPLEDEKTVVNVDKHAAARLEWYIDLDFLDVSPLFTAPEASNSVKLRLDQLVLLCLLDTHDRLQGLETKEEHFYKFRQWVAREKVHAESGNYPVVKSAPSYVKLSPDARKRQIMEKFSQLSKSQSIGFVATGIIRICEHAEGLFTGKVDTLDLLMKDNVLTEIYNAVSFGFGDFVRMLASTKPNLRILEVGAGNSPAVEATHPIPSTSSPDISARFFAQAKERFATFNLSSSPRHLVLSEDCAVARAPGYVFGNFSGWWLGELDDRKWELYVMPERWDRELKAASFTGADSVVYDAEEPFQYHAAIVASPNKQLIAELKTAGMEVTTATVGDILPADRDIIATLDLESRFFDNISEDRCIVDPRSAQTVGMFRVARAELAVPIFSLEIDTAEPKFTELVASVYQKPDLLDTLRWVESPLQDELEANQVEVDTRAVGLNFRDIMVSMGVLKFGKTPSPDLEITGIVNRVGSKVNHVKVGDRFCGVATDGWFTTHAILLDSLIAKIPETLDFTAGATMPACYTTAVQALIDVNQLQQGQTALIHSAAGGVGHAAIDLAKMVDAEIFATVGSAEKTQSVDIVLNSLSGELLHASWECVAEFRKLVEPGKRDLVGFGKLDLEPFLLNRSYCYVDLAHAMAVRPASVRAITERRVKMLEDGKIHPIGAVSAYEAPTLPTPSATCRTVTPSAKWWSSFQKMPLQSPASRKL